MIAWDSSVPPNAHSSKITSTKVTFVDLRDNKAAVANGFEAVVLYEEETGVSLRTGEYCSRRMGMKVAAVSAAVSAAIDVRGEGQLPRNNDKRRWLYHTRHIERKNVAFRAAVDNCLQVMVDLLEDGIVDVPYLVVC